MITRTEKTEVSYINRALWVEARAINELKKDEISPVDVANYAISMKSGWAKSTWRQIKASLSFRYSQMGTEDAEKAIEILKSESQEGCVQKSTKTSALRKKSYSNKELEKIISNIRCSRSKYAKILIQWLTMGIITGLRPHEWGHSEIVHEKEKVFLRVKNGKHTNGRGNGETRNLDITIYPTAIIQNLSAFSSYMRARVESDEYKDVYNGCQVLLCRINRSLGFEEKRIQLYSPRHRFSSEAKKVMEPSEVAALLGHATDKTATMHYGKARHAKGGVIPQPVQSEVNSVRAIKNFAVAGLHKAGVITAK